MSETSTETSFDDPDEALLYDVFCRVLAVEFLAEARSLDGFRLARRRTLDGWDMVITTGLGREFVYEWDGTIEDAVGLVVDSAELVRYDLGYDMLPPPSAVAAPGGVTRTWTFGPRTEPVIDRSGSDSAAVSDREDEALLYDVFRRVAADRPHTAAPSVRGVRLRRGADGEEAGLILVTDRSTEDVLEWDGTIEHAVSRCRGVGGRASPR